MDIMSSLLNNTVLSSTASKNLCIETDHVLVTKEICNQHRGICPKTRGRCRN